MFALVCVGIAHLLHANAGVLWSLSDSSHFNNFCIAGKFQWRSKTIDGPTAIDDFAAKANEALLGAAVTAASFFARAGAKAAEHVPQLSEEEKNKKMSLSGRAALASASSVASVAAYATGGTISKGASACKVAKSVNDLRSSGGSGKVGKAVAVAQRTGISSGAEAQELKRTTSGTASRLLASLSEAAEIVAAGANKGVAEAVEARYGEDVAKRISEALPGDKESAVLLPGADTTGDSVSITAASKNPELGCPTQSEQQASTKLQPEPQSEPQSEPQLEPQSESQPEAQLEQQLEPEIASKTLPQLAALTTALAVRTGRGDPEQDEVSNNGHPATLTDRSRRLLTLHLKPSSVLALLTYRLTARLYRMCSFVAAAGA
eukprot:COSAG02_NODE_2244_length_9392_cov_7.783170_2_plen_377_part_00